MADLAQSIDNLLNVVVNYGIQQDAMKRNEERYLAQQERSDAQIEKSDIRYAAEIARLDRDYNAEIDKENISALLSNVDRNSDIEDIKNVYKSLEGMPVKSEIGESTLNKAIAYTGNLMSIVKERDEALASFLEIENWKNKDITENWNSTDFNKALKNARLNAMNMSENEYDAISKELKTSVNETENIWKMRNALIDYDVDKNLKELNIGDITPDEATYLNGMYRALKVGDYETANKFFTALPGAKEGYEDKMFQGEVNAIKAVGAQTKMEETSNISVAKSEMDVTLKDSEQLLIDVLGVKKEDMATISKSSDPTAVIPFLARQITKVTREFIEKNEPSAIKDYPGLQKAFNDRKAATTEKEIVASEIALADFVLRNSELTGKADYAGGVMGMFGRDTDSRKKRAFDALLTSYRKTYNYIDVLKSANERVGSINKQLQDLYKSRSPERKTPQSADDYFNLIGK